MQNSLVILSLLFISTSCGSDSPGSGGADGGPSPSSDAAGGDAQGFDAGPVQCAPRGAEDVWVLEGQEVRVKVQCDTELVILGADFSFPDLPAGASYDSNTATLIWVPGLDQAAVWQIKIVVERFGEQGVVQIGVADKFSDENNVPVVDPLAYPLEYGVPVFFLSPRPVAGEPYTPTSIIYRGREYLGEAKTRGVTSLKYPKNSYTLKFPGSDRFNEPDFGDGFLDKKKVVLTQTFDDNSYIRHRLAFELWNRLDPVHLPVQHYQAVVYFDSEFWGVYTVSDHIDRFLIASFGLNEMGNLYKARTHACNFNTTYRGEAKVELWDGYEKKHGDPPEGMPGAYADLESLISFVATSSEPAFRDGIGDLVDLRDYQDWWVLAMFTLAEDSAGKNSYHYHDPNEGLWRLFPWDFNASFGQNWLTERIQSDPWETFTWPNYMWERFLSDPALASPMRARLASALQGPLSLDDVHALIDEYSTFVDPVARRDWSLWEDSYRSYPEWDWRTDFTSFDDEVDYLRTWSAVRWSDLNDAVF